VEKKKERRLADLQVEVLEEDIIFRRTAKKETSNLFNSGYGPHHPQRRNQNLKKTKGRRRKRK